MSFMPNVGTVVKMKDGRLAAVSSFSPTGDEDRVIFSDGHEESTTAWDIFELLTEEDEAPDKDPLKELQSYLEVLGGVQ
jgi:hypothetical protein